MSKKKVKLLLDEQTEKLSTLSLDDSLTTDYFVNKLNIARNTISQYLNELVKENQAIKIKSRPTYFLSKTIFEKKFFHIKGNEFNSLEELEYQDSSMNSIDCDPFEKYIGYNKSLKFAIEQIKACVHYPDIGLPFMLHGETGTGKSYLAKITHEYCCVQGLIDKEAPFYELNCSQYYHNQELLSSILFGYKKGSFTGATEDRIGLIEAADGGVLFLDECHRLDPESQEKLFTFLDQGTFSRMGENNIKRNAKVRIIFATTENIQESFLRTFLRRVPITIAIPNLQNRTKIEISTFMYSFFIQEAQKLNRSLSISSWIIHRLLLLKYTDNVGELKNIIKFICASSFSKQVNEETLEISADTLDGQIKDRLFAINEIEHKKEENILICSDSLVSDFINDSSIETKWVLNFFKSVNANYEKIKNEKLSPELMIHALSKEANQFFEHLSKIEIDNQSRMSIQFLVNNIKDLVHYIEGLNYLRIKGNFVVALSHYLFIRNQINIFPFLLESQRMNILAINKKFMFSEEKMIQSLADLLETKLDIKLNDEESILLTYYLKSISTYPNSPFLKAVIVAHGFSTASSIAESVNRFLDAPIFESFDMPFDETTERIAAKLEKYIELNGHNKGIVLLVDMGSLLILGEKLINKSSGPILTINNVTTPQALFVGELIKSNSDIEQIGKKILAELPTTYDIKYPQRVKEKIILTISQSGLDGAEQLKQYLTSALPMNCPVKVEAIDTSYLDKYELNGSIFKQYDVIGIIGNLTFELKNIPNLSIESLISGGNQDKFNQIFSFMTVEEKKELNNQLVKKLSINRLVSAMTILDVNRVIEYINQFIQDVELNFHIELTNSQKAMLYVHIAGVIERIIRNVATVTYQSAQQSLERKKDISLLIRLFRTIEQAYNISIPQDEIEYIYDIMMTK